MFAFFQCVAEAVVENGVRVLAEMGPGGVFAYNVAECPWSDIRRRVAAGHATAKDDGARIEKAIQAGR